MSCEASDSTNVPDVKSVEINMSTSVESDPNNSERDAPSKFSASGISTWAKSLKIPQPFTGTQELSPSGNSGKSSFSRFTSGLGLSPKSPPSEESSGASSPTTSTGILGTITKGLVDSSKNAVKAVQVKARHVVSQNKRRYQDEGFDLDMTYITENIIAMGFPAGDMSSGFFGYVEGFYRNHMEEVIKFFETYHKDKYKVYNLCSERLYDASLFEGKVASFPFDDHNCPPIQLIISFCQSAYSWLKEDIENVVVVHCKAGMARTGLMISSLLLYLKFFPTAEESIDYYNQKRCTDGKGLVLPSQIRYVKYFERILAYFNGENQPGRRCMLRGFRLHSCPYWIRPSITVSDHNGELFSTKKHPRTKDLSSEDFWFSAPKKGIMVFALPGEPGLTELAGDFKVHFHDGKGDFYCWLNTTMIENRKVLNTSDLDGFDKRKLPSPGFQVEVVLVDYDPAAVAARPPSETSENSGANSASMPTPGPAEEATAAAAKDSKKGKDDEFSDSNSEESASSKTRQTGVSSHAAGSVAVKDSTAQSNADPNEIANLTRKTEQVALGSSATTHAGAGKETGMGTEVSGSAGEVSEFKAMAADASIFSFGDDEDEESE
ncbi:phosphatidylinositol 3,4,5-trisphosphate 3-phosphatase and protein-tyrosine-phosphatase PTEN2A-like [Salvia splendens]|uniref:phosphatidylinositol 3,4,5-trisphosphate 3-phosphatase and protein-tyrosine-phosphatase PTEN2A-like n=1 Tax=Salvia splendens TaxID=180675 RepID=UPI001C270D0B|nr:phosphatidylinositol 3,4,5-trisphosphate 3-phosphatase and protein-tyrosine-phosphatase PTEN2A-like [Salvia splendens]XP_042062345.1 phosphatidylinositol 3,4,5-trisphosphate 3-phosphatase and protein-tyrosine-phosphatase PTEN2A-like [Salvia splendens]XP_042062346.1 phosphatidylinositol 3,4,5-trisphosphate 3-phosphatase and protein-tyrosine-phosphatase PTEN2A-like [Salvia splendens]